MFDLIAGSVAVIAFVILLSKWKAGRALFVESISHPFRSGRVPLDKDGAQQNKEKPRTVSA